MDKTDFQKAKLYIRIDIEREMQLASASVASAPASASASGFTGSSGAGAGFVAPSLAARGGAAPSLHAGGGNFLAALGLLCYTEWAGKIGFGHTKPNGQDCASANFNSFFDLLGSTYVAVRQPPHSLNVYGRLRCGLAHEYFAKSPIDIHMLSAPGLAHGVSVDSAGRVTFVVADYFTDFMRELDVLERRLFR